MSSTTGSRRVSLGVSIVSAAAVLASCLLTAGLYAQSTGGASPAGQCSAAGAGNDGVYTIACGVDPDQGAQMVRILNRILTGELSADAVMAKLDEIRPLDPNAPQISYTYRGVQRVVTRGVTTTGSGDGTARYVEMVKALQSGSWNDLLDAAEDQIEERPEWLTPYVFSGIAQIALGEPVAAIERLEHAERGIAGNPDYDGIRELLARTLLEARTRTP